MFSTLKGPPPEFPRDKGQYGIWCRYKNKDKQYKVTEIEKMNSHVNIVA